MLMHRFLFTAALTCTSRVVHLRDRLLGRVPRNRPECSQVRATQHTIANRKNLLDAVFVEPVCGTPQVAVLICHGIGEVVSQWFPIQRIFAENGIASLVFDYSRYGHSTGLPDWPQLEQDAVASFELLRRLAPSVPLTVLGFSLGTGIVPAILDRIAADRLVLCAGYSSFRSAARAAWIPPFLSFLVPPIWSAKEALRECKLPVLIVQGDCDRLFQMDMAHELLSCCNGRADFLVLPARRHNAPFYTPTVDYWGPIISWMLQPCFSKQANNCRPADALTWPRV